MWKVDACPCCGSTGVEAKGYRMPGMHVMGRYHCSECTTWFLHDLPVGFGVDRPMVILERDGSVLDPGGESPWLRMPLERSFRMPEQRSVQVERVVNRSCNRVVVLNTLDFLYGHVLLKLFNAHHYLDQHPDLGLVVIVPRMFAWLVPEGVAEAWVVDVKLGEGQSWFTGLEHWFADRLAEYDEVDFARAYAHPEFAPIQIERFTGCLPFPLDVYADRTPCFTLVLREDRLWYRSWSSKQAHRATRRLGLRKLLHRLWLTDQHRLVRTFVGELRRRLPNARFQAVGLGRPGGLGSRVEDLRTERMDEATERRWCAAYAASHVVIGVHGSNMILPTAHAAGCIEILPYDRYENIVQDISVRYEDRLQLFHYRFVDEFAGPNDVARHAVSMITDQHVFFRDNRTNVFPRS